MDLTAKVLSIFLFIVCLCANASAATYTVTKTADTNDGACNADCSLREAIAAAAATPDNDLIVFASLFNRPQTITLSGTDLIINSAGTLEIRGPGPDRLTVSGNNASRVFTNNTGSIATISGMRITGGTGTSTIQSGRGGGVYNQGGNLTLAGVWIAGNTAANGGGWNNAGTATVTVINSAVFNNTTTGAGGAAQNFSGNTLNIINSSIYSNTCNSTLTGGGAIQANGTLNIVNTTFADNRAQGGAGGAIYFNGAALTMTNSTIAGNTSTSNGGGIHKTTANPLNIRNSIIASNTGAAASPDATGAYNSLGNNIVATVGTSTGWIASDLPNTNPLLGPLGFYGGNGYSLPLLSGSPALNAGQGCVFDLSCTAANPLVAVTTDQRGAARSQSAVDIGAFESNAGYTAFLPRAIADEPYIFPLAPNTGGFTLEQTAGSFGAVRLAANGSIATLFGTPTGTGVFTGTITVSNATNSAAVNYALPVLSSAEATSVSGRVVLFGEPYAGAVVALVNQNGVARSARTNQFGNYYFDNVPVGDTVTVRVLTKRLQLSPRTVVVYDAVNLNFEVGIIIPSDPKETKY